MEECRNNSMYFMARKPHSHFIEPRVLEAFTANHEYVSISAFHFFKNKLLKFLLDQPGNVLKNCSNSETLRMKDVNTYFWVTCDPFFFLRSTSSDISINFRNLTKIISRFSYYYTGNYYKIVSIHSYYYLIK